MRKIVFLIILISATLFSFGQPKGDDGAVVTFDPAQFTAEDLVTMTVDLTACPTFVAGSDAYLWSWITGVGDHPGNGEWSNSSEANTLTNNGDGTYTFVFQPTIAESFGVSPSQLKEFGLLLKLKDGSWQTNDITVKVTPLEFVDEIGRTFPASVSINDIITVYLNQAIASDPALMFYSGDLNLEVTPYKDETAVGATKTIGATKVAGQIYNVYSATLMPSILFDDVTSLSEVNKLVYRFVSTDPEGSVSSPEIIKNLIVFE